MAPEDAIVPAEPENPRAGDHCCAVLLHLLEVLEAKADAFVQGREVEPLHQLRVSARRLRAALSFFEPIRHGDEELERARRRIRKLALPFGQLRDLDVFLEHLDDGVAPVALGDRARLRKVLVKRRDHLADDVVRELGKKRWRRELRWVRDRATAGAWRDSPAAVVDARRFASERLDLWWWSFLAGSEGLGEKTAGQRHRVRIEAKKLRYATEVTAELFADREPECTEFTEGLKDIQDALGALNDRAVAARIVREAGFEPTAAPDEGEDMGRALAARAGLVAQGPYWEPVR